MPAYRRLGIKVITAASNMSRDISIKDTLYDLERFERSIEKLRFDSEGMELSLEMLEDAHEKKLTISEIPTVIRYDVPKGSNFTAVSHGFTVLLGSVIFITKETAIVLGVPRFIGYWSSYGIKFSKRSHWRD